MAVLLRPGKTPSGAEVRTLLKHLVRRRDADLPGGVLAEGISSFQTHGRDVSG